MDCYTELLLLMALCCVTVGRVQAVAFVPCKDNPHWLVTAASDGCLILWDTDAGKPLRRLHKQPKDVQAFAFNR